MPLPKPKAGETQDDFIERCMGNPTMNEEYPDNKQRLAVCHSQWEGKKSMENKETRFLGVELRINREQEEPKIEGYAAVFNKLSEDLGGFREKIKPGAFKKAIKSSDPRALFDHDAKYVLGRKGAGTLTLKEDNRGLFFSVSPPATTWAKDLMVSIDRGDIHQCSFGFTLGEDEWKETKEGVIRTLNQIDRLLDVSVVTYPAYPDTAVALRKMEEWMGSEQHESLADISVVVKIDAEEFIQELSEIRNRISELMEKTESSTEPKPVDNEQLDGEPTQPETRMSLEELEKEMDEQIKLLKEK